MNSQLNGQLTLIRCGIGCTMGGVRVQTQGQSQVGDGPHGGLRAGRVAGVLEAGSATSVS